MKRRIYQKTFFTLVTLFFICLPILALAQSDSEKEKDFPNLGNVEDTLINTGGTEGMGVDIKTTTADGSFYKALGFFIAVFVNLVGIAAVGFLAYAGWLWAGARGNEEKVTQAKNIIFNSIIALIIVLAAWLIFTAVFSVLGNVDQYV